ncbi:MAG: PorV/PorQ family protein [Ignavibacteriae bacterium]|nr:PorV/PorQ family protein [Ignavibacteriota bacterium]
MKKIFITSIALIFSIAITSNVNAQLFGTTSKVGTTAAQFLKIGAGARAIGMGGAFASIPDDIYSIYWNPAGIATSRSNGQVSFNHANWIAEMDYDFAGGSINLGGMGTIFGSFTSFRIPEDKVRTIEDPEGDGRTWDAGSISIAVGYAKMLTDRFSIGFTAKFVQERIWNSTASGFAFDVGTLYRTPFNDLMIGAAISNFGTSMQLDGRDIQFNSDPDDNIDTGPNNVKSLYDMDAFDMPLSFRIGLSMNVLETRFLRATASLDAAHPNDNVEYVNAGVEFAYDETLFLRAGYKSLFYDEAEEGLTLGGGIKYEFAPNLKIVVNYAYADFGLFDNVQFFDFGLVF